MTSLQGPWQAPLLFFGSVARRAPSLASAAHAIRVAEVDLIAAREWLVCCLSSRAVCQLLPPPRPHDHLYAASEFRVEGRRRLAQGKARQERHAAGVPAVGYAGTGKTTLARHIADGVDGEVKFAAFTGKAALVMRNKGCDNASTIHSLIYRAREFRRRAAELRIMGRRAGIQGQADRDRRVLDGGCRTRPRSDVVRLPAVGAGDPAQLPPIQGGGFFTDCEPDAMLTRCTARPRTIRSYGCRWISARAASSRSAATARAKWSRATNSTLTG